MAFALDLSKFVEKAKANAELVVQKVAIDMLYRVVDRSPVGNPDLWKSPAPAGYVGGRFRANWQVSFDVPKLEAIQKVDAAGGSTKQAGATMIQAFTTANQSIWMMNNVPYAIPLEYGHSKQSPAGVVRVTIAEFQSFVNDAVRELP